MDVAGDGYEVTLSSLPWFRRWLTPPFSRPHPPCESQSRLDGRASLVAGFLETGARETCARVTMLMAPAPENTGWEETESRCNCPGLAVAVFRRHYHRDNGDST